MARHFSLEEIEELRRQLVGNSVKDTDMEDASAFQKTDTVAIVQSGKNKRITMDTMVDCIVDGIDEEFTQHEKEREANEVIRIANEENREYAEKGRASSESTRVTNESARVEAEAKRSDAETVRVANEAARVSNEQTRQALEAERKQNEANRKSAEVERAEAENERKFTEQIRQEGEALRSSAEVGRNSAEQTRVVSETNRVDAEKERVSNENTRKTNESARATEEATREANEKVRVEQEATREANEKARQETLPNCVQVTEQTFTDAQQTQARKNITALSDADGSVQSRHLASELELGVIKSSERVNSDAVYAKQFIINTQKKAGMVAILLQQREYGALSFEGDGTDDWIRLQNIDIPKDDYDATNKKYVDNLAAGVSLGDTDLQSNITLTNEQVEAYKNPSASCFVILSGTAYRVYLDVFGVDDTGVVVYRCNRNTNFLAGSVIDSCIQTSLEGNTLTLFVGLQTSIEESEIDEICK